MSNTIDNFWQHFTGEFLLAGFLTWKVAPVTDHIFWSSQMLIARDSSWFSAHIYHDFIYSRIDLFEERHRLEIVLIFGYWLQDIIEILEEGEFLRMESIISNFKPAI